MDAFYWCFVGFIFGCFVGWYSGSKKLEIARLKRIIEDYADRIEDYADRLKAVAPLFESGPDLLEVCGQAHSELRHTRFASKAYPGLLAVAEMLGTEEDDTNAWLRMEAKVSPKFRSVAETLGMTVNAEKLFDPSPKILKLIEKVESMTATDCLMYLDDKYSEVGGFLNELGDESDEGG